MGVAAKFFIQSETIGQDGLSTFQLGAVCRGELNKDWAAATPSGNAKLIDPLLTEVWKSKQAGTRKDAEVYLRIEIDPEGLYEMVDCAFAYNGCAVKFIRKYSSGLYTPGEMQMTVNASPATAALRKAYAEGLLSGQPPRASITVLETLD